MQALSITGNWFATLAIFTWPIAMIALYRTKSPAEATAWSILAAMLLLPTGASLKLEMIPAFDKNSVPNVCAFVGCLILVPRQRSRGGWGVVEFLAILLIFGPVATSVLNSDTIVIGDRVLPGVGIYDGISALLSQLALFLPFFLGRQLFRDAADLETLVRCLAIAGLLYSIPMLFEVRFSPQLSNWIYGISQGGFNTEVRYGGFRPVVFLRNGLAAAFFLMTAFLASMTLWRLHDRIKPLPSSGIPVYLATVLIFCKSGGSLVYALFAGIFTHSLSAKAQLRLAVILTMIAISYPVLRMVDVFPDQILVEAAASFDNARAESLKFRFDQEHQLLERAYQRFAFGWGRYGRNRVYEESGKDSSITDGAWIQTLGQFGVVGFLAQFGLLALPVFRAASAQRLLRVERDRLFVALVALIVALGIVEQLPNSSVSPWSWLLAGALLGRAEGIIESARSPPSNRSKVFGMRSGSTNA